MFAVAQQECAGLWRARNPLVGKKGGGTYQRNEISG